MAFSNKPGRAETDFVKGPTPEHNNLTTAVSSDSKCSGLVGLIKHPKKQFRGLLVDNQ